MEFLGTTCSTASPESELGYFKLAQVRESFGPPYDVAELSFEYRLTRPPIEVLHVLCNNNTRDLAQSAGGTSKDNP